MSRPVKCRRICFEPDYNEFIPDGIVNNEIVLLNVDEYEAIRLLDLEKLTQEECALQMGVSRTTITALYESARYKISDCIINGKKMIIAGGQYSICNGMNDKKSCYKNCMIRDSITKVSKGENIMRIAVTYENGEVYGHFGHTENFKIYDVLDNKVIKEEIVNTNGQGHGALAGFLKNYSVDVLICGGIGGGAQNALAKMDIKFFGGVSGNCDEVVKDYLKGELDYNPNEKCDHHNHEGEDGNSCSHGNCNK